jgi:hypothetical protein
MLTSVARLVRKPSQKGSQAFAVLIWQIRLLGVSNSKSWRRPSCLGAVDAARFSRACPVTGHATPDSSHSTAELWPTLGLRRLTSAERHESEPILCQMTVS